MIAGQKRAEQAEFTKLVGVGTFSVIAVNPEKNDLAKILGMTEEQAEKLKDQEYTSEDTDGNKRVRLSFWLKNEIKNHVFNLSISLTDKPRVSKTDKPQWINNFGRTSWADTKESLPEWMTKDGAQVRQALMGEEELYKFLSAWQSAIDWKTITDFTVDTKALFKGNTKELKALINSEFATEVFAMATIRTSDDGKEYQSIYGRNFLPGWNIKPFRVGGKAGNKNLIRFFDEIEDPEHGCKDIYDVAELHEFDPAAHVATSGRSIDDTNSDY